VLLRVSRFHDGSSTMIDRQQSTVDSLTRAVKLVNQPTC